MYCSYCGKKIDDGQKFCNSCGKQIQNEVLDKNKKSNGIKVISILALIFSIVFYPVGLVLSIIGIVKCNKYKKENNKKSSYFVFNIAGLVISIIMIFMTIFFIIMLFLLTGFFSKTDKNLQSTWVCKSTPFSTVYNLKVNFDGSNFSWAKYADEDNNVVKGTYKVLSRDYSNGEIEYELLLRPKYYVISGNVINDYNNDFEIEIEFSNQNATIKLENSQMYYCVKR